jgi:Flp pilus assembly protein TadG
MNLRALSRRLRSEEHGVVLILVAMLMTLFIALAALAIDLGALDGAQRQAQAAADAGALAGAASLSNTTVTAPATATATTYANANYPAATSSATVLPTALNQVTVRVTAHPPNFFGKAFPVGATAVATGGSTGGAPGAIFTSDTSCTGGGVNLGTTGITINGGIRSSGSMDVSAAHGGTYPSTTYACNLNPSTGTTNNSFDGSPSPSAPTLDTTLPTTWPDDYTADFPVYPLTAVGDPNCTASLIRSDWNFQSLGSTTLTNGVYCADTIEFNESGLTCTCTFVSGSFTLNQGPDTFTPAYRSLSFYDVNDTSLNVNSNGPNFFNGGLLFAPKASVTVNAPSGAISGFVEAKDVTTNGGGGSSTWTGSGPTVNGIPIAPFLTQ